MAAELSVFFETKRVGTIEPQDGGPSFIYDPAWLGTRGAFPLSLLMPLSAPRVSHRIFRHWAANLLPEGSRLRALARHLGAAPEDTMAILEKVGRDTAGALSFGQPGGQPGSAAHSGWTPVASETALERIVNELPQMPLPAGEGVVSGTLAGVQCKLPVVVDADGRICLPGDGAPSTHILKPASDHLFGGVHNEALCLVLARRCGLNAPAVATGKAGSSTYLLVTRYDRIEQAGSWRRLHQENFFQALGIARSGKYDAHKAGPNGPSLADMLSLARCVMCAPDVLSLIDYFVFNILVCNPDTHARNFSLMISDNGVSLAPIYGVRCVAAWDGISHKLDRMLAAEHIDWPQWEAFAADCGLNTARLLARVETLARAVLADTREAAAAVAAMPAGPEPLMPRLVEAIETRARRHRSIAKH